MKRASTVVGIFLLFGGTAQAAGDAEAGHKLAQLWCTSCHIVDAPPHGAGAATPAPAFPTIARRHQDRAWVRAWLVAPHPQMPNLDLSRQQIDDVIAYLDSLR